MSEVEKTVVVQQLAEGFDGAGDASSGEEHGQNGLRRLHAALRGRYHWAIILGLLLGAIGATTGYLLYTPTYSSEGIINVEVNQQVILQRTEDKMLRDPGSYIGQQVNLMQSPEVIRMAMQNSQWQQLGVGLTREAMVQFEDSLKIKNRYGETVIRLQFEDENPDVALIGAEVTIKAYMDIWKAQNDLQSMSRFNELNKLRNRYSSAIKNLESRVLEIAGEYGEDALAQSHKYMLGEQQRLETELRTVEIEIAAARRQLQASHKPFRELTEMEISEQDSRMSSYLGQRDAIEQKIHDLQLHHQDTHPSVLEAQSQLNLIDGKIAAYVEQFNRLAEQREQEQQHQAGQKAENEIAAMELQLENLGSLTEEAKGKAVEIGKKLQDIATLRLEIEQETVMLQRTEARIEELSIETAVPGRVSVLSAPDPLQVECNNEKDLRNLVAAGGMGGFMFGFGLITLMGLLDSRFRSVEDANDIFNQLRMLGMLPQLPENVEDLEQASMAAHCVHQIRGALQLSMNHDKNKRIMSVTSSSPNDGKTSLTLALGMSFAASGMRTLIVDFDLVGRGLSKRVEQLIRRRIGQILLSEGLVTAGQLKEGLEQAKQHGERLGDSLVKLGYLSDEQIHQAASIQEKPPIGLVDFMDGQSFDKCVANTGTANLMILPIGSVGAEHMTRMSPASVQRLVDQARDRYDVVLLDTGPVPGSLEASMVASSADQVIFTISQGLQGPVAQRAITHLHSIGATIAGVVFNRATARDIEVFGSTSRSMMSRPHDAARADRAAAAAPTSPPSFNPRFGPLEGVTAWSLPAPSDDDAVVPEPDQAVMPPAEVEQVIEAVIDTQSGSVLPLIDGQISETPVPLSKDPGLAQTPSEVSEAQKILGSPRK